MKTEAQSIKVLGLITACIGALIAIMATTIILTSCSAIDKNKAEIEQIADDLANEAIEDVISELEKK